MRAVITGASSGMGIEFARLLAKAGYDLIITARREDRLNALKTVIERKYGVSVTVYTADLSVPEEAIKFSEFCFKAPVKILINNAGFGNLGKFEEIPFGKETELVNTNITALTILTKSYIKSGNDGFILNIASIASFMPGPLLSSYYASKAYVLRLSTAVNEEMRHSGRKAHITAMCPGPMKTGFFKTAGASREFAVATPRKCAVRALNALFAKKEIVFSDSFTHLLAVVAKFMPLRIVTKISYMVQKSKFLG